MQRRSPKALDGFISPKKEASFNRQPSIADVPMSLKNSGYKTPHVDGTEPVSSASPNLVEDAASVSEQLKSLPDSDALSGKKRKKNWFTKHKVRYTILIILVILLAAGGYFGWKILNNGSKIFKGNIFNAVASLAAPDKPLKTDKNGNTNILLLGTSESDPNHPGAQLTDSMMVMSINQTSHAVFLMSIPRDLWVKGNRICSAGYQYKINATYECNLGTSLGGLSTTQNDEATAEASTATLVSGVTGVDVNYVIHMNLAVIQQVIDAIGGIDITIESPDPRGILDTNFDWRCNYKCNLVKYPNGPAHLTGTNAMWLAQARNDAGGYGLPRSNFDREANQRKILIATKDKATSVGFLANPLNAIKLLDALGTNIHTTIDSSEIKTFIDVAKAVPSTNITSIDIMDNGPGVLTTGTGPDGSSIVRPVAGLLDYTGVQAFTAKLLAGYAPVIADAAPIDVINASGTSGAGQTEADALTQKGYTIGKVSSASATYKNTSQYTIVDLSKGAKPGTLAMLKKDLGVTKTVTKLPDGITSTATFVVILGSTSTSSSTSSAQ